MLWTKRRLVGGRDLRELSNAAFARSSPSPGIPRLADKGRAVYTTWIIDEREQSFLVSGAKSGTEEAGPGDVHIEATIPRLQRLRARY